MADPKTTAPLPKRAKAAAISLPKGGGAIRGMSEKLSFNAVNGTANLSVPIPSIHERNGFGPNLELHYDSGAGNGPFGMGWSLHVPAITRRTDKGLPRYQDALEGDIFVLAGAEDLVPLLDASGVRIQGSRTVHGITYDVFPYRPRVEGMYATIERWVARPTGTAHWRTISNDNITTLFGFDPDTTIGTGTEIFAWKISRRFDGHGNLITYTYAREAEEGIDLTATHEANRLTADRVRQRYLKSVRYGFTAPYYADASELGPEPALPDDWHFEVVFDYGEHDALVPRPSDHLPRPVRPDPFSSYRAGYEVRTYRRCLRVLLFHHFASESGVGRDCLVQALELQYDDQQTPPDPTAPIYSLLTSITHASFRRDGAGYARKPMPPLEVEYTKPVIDPTVHTVPPDSIENLPQGLDGTYFRLTDLDAEGLPGILSDDETAWRFQRNLSPLTGAPQPDGSEPPVTAAFEPIGIVATVPTSHTLRGGVQLLDVRGEGRLDAVSFAPDASGFWTREPETGWQAFTAFRSQPSINAAEPNVHIVDLTGDGRPDVLVGEDNVWTMYPSLGEVGYGQAELIRAPWDENAGGGPVYSNESVSMHLVDMTGDGMSDLVRVRNGEVCFWPNLGYGRFGRKVTMTGGPRFADQGFDPKRLRLVDIDGSGTSDLLYVGVDGVSVWFNRSGNSWSEPQRLAVFPTADNLSHVQTADLLGTGTACLVWSSPLPSYGLMPIRYVDLMSGQKPHLLARTRNNLGAETRLTYAPSTRFYLEDRRAGIHWLTRLPFPVHVVERVETYDWVARTRFVTRYAYHHGHYDGVEREFRGFGMVETWDTEVHREDTAFPPAENWDATSWSPPVHIKTWFHTGVYVEGPEVSKQFEGEYWIEPALRPAARAADREAMSLRDSTIPDGLVAVEEREACRALKGHVLRVETYALDDTAQAEHPYDIVEHNYEVRRLQPIGGNRYAVFSVHDRETLEFHYDRIPDDPRVTHDIVLEVDAFDHPLRAMSVVYPRRPGYVDPEPGLDPTWRQMLAYDQTRLHMVATEHSYTNAPIGADSRRTPEPSEVIVAELTGFAPASNRAGITNLFTPEELDAAWLTAWDGTHDVPFEELVAADVDATGPQPTAKTRRIVDRVRTYYRADDLSATLPLGTVETLALPANAYRLALTPGLLSRALDNLAGAAELTEGGYVQLAGDSGWWIPDDEVRFSAGDLDSAAVELAEARQHFFLIRREIDPFGGVHRVDYDAYDVLPVRTVDPVGNEHLCENDYRVLAPREITDPNGNRSEVAFDIRGLVAGSAIKGKVTETLGDTLVGFDPDPDDAAIAAYMASPLASPLAFLQGASARTVYDVFAYYRTRDLPQPQPTVASMIEREIHVSDPGGDTSRCKVSFSYCDGFGRHVQRKLHVEAGPLQPGDPDVAVRWVCSGWSVHDNKGRSVREFEPFFTTTHLFEFSAIVGVSRYTFYDPIGRAVASLAPNNTWTKAVYEPWRESKWDASDTVLISDPRTDLDVGDHFRRLLGSAPGAFTSWYDLRIGGTFGVDAVDKAAEQDAATKAAAHAATPEVDHFDSLGRVCVSVSDFGAAGRQPVRNAYDAEGGALAVIDPLGRRVAEYMVREPHGGGFQYISGRDVAGRELLHVLMDAGIRRVLRDISGIPIRTWDARGHVGRLRYDAIRRPTHRYVATSGGPERLVARTLYGEAFPDLNLRGKMFRHYDQCGLSANESCDFKGNLVDRSRTLAKEYRDELDWSVLGDETDPAVLDTLGGPLLVTEDRFIASAFHDALNRPVQAITPYRATSKPNVVLATYNESSKASRIDLWEQVTSVPTSVLDPATADVHLVTSIKYDAYGDRISIANGNGTVTERTIDPLTKRLVRILTTRPPSYPADERIVQDLRYTYDPSGNVTRTRDDADIHDVVFFKNRRVEPSTDYTYDAAYRLIRATGREHLGQTGGALAAPQQITDDDSPRTRLAHPGDGNAVGTYVEAYDYDPLGNLLSLFHTTATGAWRRSYAYAEPSQIDPSVTGNRLSATSLPGDPAGGPYSARYAYDAHGNTIKMPHLASMTWDERDSMRSTARQAVNSGTPETTYYRYDPSDVRLRKVTDRASAGGAGTRKSERIYLGAFELYREYEADGVTVKLARETTTLLAERKVVAVLERRIAGTEPGPARLMRYQYVTLTGNAALELADDAAVISYEEYYPYGSTSYQAVRSQVEVPKRYRHHGKEFDEESGLYYSFARYYAPWLGRWLSPDPMALADGPNVYQYVHSNPINVVDPTGTVGLILGFTAAELFALGGMATCTAMGAVVVAQHPPKLPDWHPFAGNEDDYQPKPADPPVKDPAPPPVEAPPKPAPGNPGPGTGTNPWPQYPWPGTGPWIGPTAPPWIIPGPLAPTIPFPEGPGPWLPPIPPVGPTLGPKPKTKPEPKTKPKPKTDPKPQPKTDPKPKPKDKDKRKKPKLKYFFVTYTKKKGGKTYVGRYRDWGRTPEEVVAKRDRKHHMTAQGYGKAKLDKYTEATLPVAIHDLDPAYWAIRGREQQMIDSLGGTTKENSKTKSGNTIRGVDKDNKQGWKYHLAANARFGKKADFTGKYKEIH